MWSLNNDFVYKDIRAHIYEYLSIYLSICLCVCVCVCGCGETIDVCVFSKCIITKVKPKRLRLEFELSNQYQFP